jgi:hypothetical protein
MKIIKKLLRDRNVIMLIGIVVGLAWGDGAPGQSRCFQGLRS